MKDSLILYTKYKKQFQMLPREQQGDLIMAIFEYGETGIAPKMEPIVAMAFSFIQEQIDYDNRKYQEKIEARREAGRKGGEAKQANAEARKQNIAKQANAKFAKQGVANQAVPEPDHDPVHESIDDERDIQKVVEGDDDFSKKAGQRFMDLFCQDENGTFDTVMWEGYCEIARGYDSKTLYNAVSRMRRRDIAEPIKYLRSVCEGIEREPKGG